MFRRAVLGGGGAYSAEASALFARMSSQPDALRKGHINTLIAALKTAGVWTKLDVLYVMAAHDAQAARLNWKSSSYDLTAVNSPTFTTDRGYAGDGSTTYLDTGFNASTAGGLYVQDDAALSVFVQTNVDEAKTTFGVANAFVDPRNAGNASLRINQGSSNSVASVNSIGLWSNIRRGASSVEHYKNGASIATASTASTALANENFAILKRGATGGLQTTRRVAAAALGNQRSAAQELALYNALAAYMTAVGA